MIIECNENQCICDPLIIPRDPHASLSETNYVSSTEWYTIDAQLSGYCITKSKEYTVYGILVIKNQVRFLISDDNGVPGFFPDCLFSIKDRTLFFDWEVNLHSMDSGTILCIGYHELCRRYSSLVGIIEGDCKAIEEFLEYKAFINNVI